MKRKALSLILVLAVLLSIMPAFRLSALAAATDSDMDALTALGINTGKAPDGYDPYSTDNPYGKNTIEISPVYELYKVGLSNGIAYPATYATTSTLQSGQNIAAHSAAPQSTTLQSVLYGSEAWGQTSVPGILGGGVNQEIASGQTTTTGDYTLISTGTVANKDANDIPANGYLKNAKNASADLGGSFRYAMSAVAAGNFDGNKGGLQAQTVMVYTSDYSSSGGLYLRFGNATAGTYGADAKELLNTATKIGNPALTYETKLVENFAENPYQLQNYLQVATGDWNGDGLDEVAVYIPEENNSRIAVYALQLTSSDNKAEAFLNPAKWSVVWTYYLREDNVVSNMVSFVSGDVNLDGTDDLAATWGYYYGPEQNKGSKAVVMFGDKGTAMLKDSQEFDLTYGSSNIVRASFAFGDMAGANSEVLVLCGQSDADLKAGNTQTRYVALYDWNGTAFKANIFQNFNLFEKKDSQYIWDAMTRAGDNFYSLPLCPANAAMISQGISGGGDLLYFDSLIIEYTEKGLNIKAAWDNTAAMQQNTGSCAQYVEYGAAAGDLTGQTGAGTLFTMTQTLSTYSENLTASYTVTGSHEEPVYTRSHYYKSWFHKLFNIKTYYTYISNYVDVADTKSVRVDYTQLTMGKAYMVAVSSDPDNKDWIQKDIIRNQADFSTNICLANTDKDSSYMSYGGRHYYTYTDPQVLSVLASPPYFDDLLNRRDLSGAYSNSSTSYSKTEGSGSGATASATIKVGAYVSYEQDIQVFGVTVASIEAEAVVTAGFTFDWEKTSTLEQTVTYNAGAGEDMVAFYSIPMEIYEYTSYVADGKGGYRQVLTTVNIPHEAAVRLLSLAEYEFIAKDYGVLPKIADNVLTHEIGDPSTYPSSTAGYNVIAQYSGTPTAVGFTGAEGGAAIGQEIAMSTETTSAFSASAGIEAKAGAGAGGFKVGVIAGAEAGGGYVMISTSGSSFSGELQNMPVEAQPYGYGMNWKIFCYRYSNGAMTFPVVSYLVSEASNPAPLPQDFSQDMASTTSNAVTLSWSYDRNIAGFKIYRYYEFPEGSGSYEVAFVPFTAGHRDSGTGPFRFTYTDTGLSPYTEYKYQIKTVRAMNPKESIYSEPMVCRTKTAVGYPEISLAGLNAGGVLPIYPDESSTATVGVANPGAYSGLSYQWQKLIGGSWTNLAGKTGDSLTISNAGAADNGLYRCRVNTIYYDTGAAQNYYISAYSDAFTTAYAKRTSVGNLSALEVIDGTTRGLKADLELYSGNAGHSVAPSGNVTFTIKGTDYAYSKTVALDQQSTTKYFDDVKAHKLYSTASVTISSLPDGVYSVEAYYSGSRVFKDYELPTKALVVVGNGTAYQMSLSAQIAEGASTTKFTYGEVMYPALVSIGKDGDGKIISTPVTGATYQLFASGADTGTPFAPGGPTPDVGSYTLKGYNASTEPVFSQEFTVAKKPITIAVENKSEVYAGTISANLPVITCGALSAAELAALKLSYTAANTAGNTVTLDNNTDPGNYRVTACTGAETPLTLYNNYGVTYVSGTYTIVGSTHWLEAKAQDYTADGAARPVGTVGISNQSDNKVKYTAGSTVLLYATPQAGYEVDTWTATFADKTTSTQMGGSTFVLLTQAQDVAVTVTFKPAKIRLTAIAEPSKGGVITCSDELFSSGAYVGYGADYEFTAIPKAGYHFSTWKIVAGATNTTDKGTANQDGSNRLTVTVGAASTAVYAVFERDAYTLSLSGDITASYLFDDDGVSSTPPVKKKIPTGTSVPGDTEITVAPKPGYGAKAGAFFTLDGVATDQSASLVFSITGNTAVALETVRNSYAVTVAAANGTVTPRVNGTVATTEQLSAVAGGSAFSLTARADRGYVFDHWKVNDADMPGSNPILTIAELDEAKTIEAVFTANTAYTAKAAVSNPARGSMNYTLRDLYGELVGQTNTAIPAEGVTVYQGESIVFMAQVVAGSMMEQWKVNADNFYTTQKTYTVDAVSSDISITAYLKAATSYAVYFDVIGGYGTLAGTIDGQSMTSGNIQYGGSDIIFAATPESGYMLDHWTITDGDTAAAENAPAVDENGTIILDPTYTISPLRQNLTVRAYFTTLKTNTVTLSPDETMGISKITYVTPINPTDGVNPDSTTASVRSGGTVKLIFTPGIGYGASVGELEQLVKGAVNADAAVTAAEQGGVYTVTVSNLKQNLDLSAVEIFYGVYHVVVGTMLNGTVTPEPAAAKAGETVTLTVKPSTGYKLSSLTLEPSSVALSPAVSAETLRYTFTMPDAEVAVSASFEAIPVTPDNGGGGGGGGAVVPAPQTIPAGSGGNTIAVGVTVAKEVATLALDKTALQTLEASSGTVSFDFTSLKDITSASIPADVFGVISGAEKISGLSIALPDAGLIFDQAALAAIGAAGSGDITLKADMLGAKTLTEDQKALVGDRPVLDLTLTAGGKQISDFAAGTVQVNVPYTLKPGEAPTAVVVWYLNDKNILECVAGQYDAATGTVVFQTSHFSKYVIGQLPFRDVSRGAWYFDSVSFAFANGLFSGTGDAGFSPDAFMTRAMLVTVLWRMEGEPKAEKASNFTDVAPGYWYEQAVAWAVENKLVSGYGNGRFGSNDQITREQMAVILMNYAKLKGYNVSATADLKMFTDSASVSSWATAAMQWANAVSLISGTGASTLDPLGNATRAQVAAVLMRFVENIAR